MAHRGMVHALTEAHRTLRPGGVVADLRPERDPGGLRSRGMLVEFRGSRGTTPVGVMREGPGDYDDYIASDHAVAQVLRQGLFLLDHSELFWLRIHFRDLRAVERYLAEEWWPGSSIPARIRRPLRRLAVRDPGGRIVASDLLRLNILRPTPSVPRTRSTRPARPQ